MEKKVQTKFKGPKPLDQFHFVCRKLHYSPRTEKSYKHWVKRYIYFNNITHPIELDEKHISNFLSHLAVTETVSAATQNVALNALVFLYKRVLGVELGDFSSMHL